MRPFPVRSRTQESGGDAEAARKREREREERGETFPFGSGTRGEWVYVACAEREGGSGEKSNA